MHRQHNPLLGRLLAGRDEPSVLEKEAQFARILEQVQPKKRRAMSFAPWFLGALGTLSAVALYFSQTTDPEFTPRGLAQTAIVKSHCLDAEASAEPPAATPRKSTCSAGDRLALELAPPQERSFAAGYVEHADGSITWLFPATGERSQQLPTTLSLFARSFDLSPLPPGAHTLSLVFSEAPLSRAEIGQLIDGADERSEAAAPITVVKQPLHLSAAEHAP